MHRLIALSAVLLLTLPGPAWAQSGTASSGDDVKKPRIRFLEFEEFFVRGHRHEPTVKTIHGHTTPQFQRLIKLRRSFVPEILKSAQLL